MRLRALNDAARRLGLHREQADADARAIAPALLAAPAEPARELKALRALAAWCGCWSPTVALDLSPGGFEGLFLDIAGVDHLFGGEDAMLSVMRRRLKAAGIPCRIALAPTPGAAWAMARWSGKETSRLDSARLRDGIASLPLAALRLDEANLRLARLFGLRRIGDLYALPRSGLARRFRDGDGLGLVRRLDQALGLAEEPLTPVRPAADYRAVKLFAEPVLDMAGIEARLPALAAKLAAQLERDGRGAARLRLTGFRSIGTTATLEVRIGTPHRQTKIWLRLLREKGLDRLDPGFGFDALALSADRTAPVAAVQPALEPDSARPAGALSVAELADRLAARLGEAAVTMPVPVPSWVPERSERRVPAQDVIAAAGLRPVPSSRPRPLLMLDPPEPVEVMAELPDSPPARFRWRRVLRHVARAEGPERLEPEWWQIQRRPVPEREEFVESGMDEFPLKNQGFQGAASENQGRIKGSDRTRDYYLVEDENGARYWLFREGLYDRREEKELVPSWWMHGLFP